MTSTDVILIIVAAIAYSVIIAGAYLLLPAVTLRRDALLIRRRLLRNILKEISEKDSKGVEVQSQLDRLDRILTGPTMPRKPLQPTTQQAGSGTGGGMIENTAVPLLGYRIFRWLLLVLLIFLISLGIFAWMTYPGNKGADATLQVDWYERVRDAGQSFIITPIFPLLAAVIGYIFGVRKGNKGV